MKQARFACVFFLLAAGCDDSAPESDAAVDASAMDAATDASLGDDADCSGEYVRALIGDVVDVEGEGVAGANVQACLNTIDGRWLCLSPVQSEESGAFRIELAPDNRCLERAAVRMSADDVVSDYCSPPLDSEVVETGIMLALSTTTAWSVDGSTLSHDSGLIFDAASPEAAAQHAERIAAGGLEGTSHCQAVQLGLSSSLGLTPEGFVRDLTLRRVPAPGLPDATPVDIVVVGGLYGELPDGSVVAEGDAHVIATGQVEGGTVDVDVSIPFLTWIGVRPR
ncbi:MAG: hypothetical protein AB8H86_30630 [Polyangiales bacterium]